MAVHPSKFTSSDLCRDLRSAFNAFFHSVPNIEIPGTYQDKFRKQAWDVPTLRTLLDTLIIRFEEVERSLTDMGVEIGDEFWGLYEEHGYKTFVVPMLAIEVELTDVVIPMSWDSNTNDNYVVTVHDKDGNLIAEGVVGQAETD